MDNVSDDVSKALRILKEKLGYDGFVGIDMDRYSDLDRLDDLRNTLFHLDVFNSGFFANTEVMKAAGDQFDYEQWMEHKNSEFNYEYNVSDALLDRYNNFNRGADDVEGWSEVSPEQFNAFILSLGLDSYCAVSKEKELTTNDDYYLSTKTPAVALIEKKLKDLEEKNKHLNKKLSKAYRLISEMKCARILGGEK